MTSSASSKKTKEEQTDTYTSPKFASSLWVPMRISHIFPHHNTSPNMCKQLPTKSHLHIINVVWAKLHHTTSTPSDQHNTLKIQFLCTNSRIQVVPQMAHPTIVSVTYELQHVCCKALKSSTSINHIPHEFVCLEFGFSTGHQGQHNHPL